MLRNGLFSSKLFVEASRGFVLLRLKPGPAEALFGITAAPMCAVADWHGRVVVRNLSLRGDEGAACRRLGGVLDGFDRRKAGKAPPALPDWGRPLARDNGQEAMSRLLSRIHPARGRPSRDPSFADLARLYASLEREMDLVRFAENYVAAMVERGPVESSASEGRAEEATLLRDLTWCINDRVKFSAIETYGRVAPLNEIAFFRERASRRSENCRNPNVVLCRSLAGLTEMAGRFDGVRDRETSSHRKDLLASLEWCAEVLAAEGRNNSACKLALDAVKAIACNAEAPEALLVYVDAFLAPKVNSDWMRDYTRKFHERNLPWLQEITDQKMGVDREAWQRWYRKHEGKLVYHRKSGRFHVDAAAAKAFRRKLQRAR